MTQGMTAMLSQAYVGRSEAELPLPCLVVDLDALDSNLAAMQRCADDSGRALRPHVKAHKCPQLAHRQLALGAVGVTCAKLGEAEVMARAGIGSILIANQVYGRSKLNVLAGLNRYADVMPAVDTPENAREIAAAATAMAVEIPVMIEVDAGIDRCGVRTVEEGLALAAEIESLPGIRLEGLLSYEARGLEGPQYSDDQRIAHSARLLETATRLGEACEQRGYPVKIVSCASTGTAKYTARVPGVTELQPGTYALGEAAYSTRDIGLPLRQALYVRAQVTAVHGKRIVLSGGRKTIGIDQGPPLLTLDESAAVECHEEHAVLDATDKLRHLRPGDPVSLIPGHCCTTANLHSHFFCVRKGMVEAIWEIAARGCVY